MSRRFPSYIAGVLSCAVLLCLATTLVSAEEIAACGEYGVGAVMNELLYTGPRQRRLKEKHGAYRYNFRCFHAQHFEDLYMFEHFLGNISGGFFIELGALDGYSYSVSYFFEHFMNWRGLLIEASPKNHVQYRVKSAKYKAHRRRTSEYLPAAVCNEEKPVTYVSKEGTGAGILEFMPKDQQQRNHKMCQVAKKDADGHEIVPSDPNSCTFSTINCVNLGKLLKEKNIPKVDLFVLDVEGAELEVLQTVDLEAVPVHYFLIELDRKAPHKDAAVRCILRKNGFVPVGRLDLNEIWVNTKFRETDFKETYLKEPVPVKNWRWCFHGQDDVTAAKFFKPPLVVLPGNLAVGEGTRTGGVDGGDVRDANPQGGDPAVAVDGNMERNDPGSDPKNPEPTPQKKNDLDSDFQEFPIGATTKVDDDPQRFINDIVLNSDMHGGSHHATADPTLMLILFCCVGIPTAVWLRVKIRRLQRTLA